MRIIEPHIHMYARTTADYEAMSRAGIEAVVEPAFWLGETRRHAGSFFDYFEHLINYEHSRAARYGIKHFVTIAMNPKEANDRELAEKVVAEMPRYLEHKHVVGVGEIGLDRINPTEEEFMVKQVELAREFEIPVLMHTPHLNKLEGVKRMIAAIKGIRFPMDRILLDHNVEDTTPISKKAGAYCGHTLYPITKLSPERAANILQKNGFDKMMINSAADWGPSDPLMVPHAIEELRSRGVKEKDIKKVVWDTPYEFFSKSGRFKL